MKLVIIVPAFNEAPVIRKVLVALKKEIASLGEVEIVVVDDGSVDATAKEAMTAGAKILSHPINRGLGGALGTGLTYAKLVNADIAVTFDADGQHDPGDIRRVIEPIRKGDADVVIGSRTLKGMQQIPFDRRIILWFGNVITKLLFSVSTSDSQSGFRAFSKPAIRQIEVDLVNQPPFRTDAIKVADQQYADHQLRIDRRPTGVAVEGIELVADRAEV